MPLWWWNLGFVSGRAERCVQVSLSKDPYSEGFTINIQ